MGKKKDKIDKSIRKLIEATSDIVKRKDGKYKVKGKKKDVKKVKRRCVHWLETKGKIHPTIEVDPDDSSKWICQVCGGKFEVRPIEQEDRDEIIQNMEELVNQLEFWCVKMGGDADDMKVLLNMKDMLPKVQKIGNNIIKNVKKRKELEDERSGEKSMSQFDAYSGYNYR